MQVELIGQDLTGKVVKDDLVIDLGGLGLSNQVYYAGIY